MMLESMMYTEYRGTGKIRMEPKGPKRGLKDLKGASLHHNHPNRATHRIEWLVGNCERAIYAERVAWLSASPPKVHLHLRGLGS